MPPDYLLEHAVQWLANGDDFFATLFSSDSTVTQHLVSRAELTALDARLPLALDVMLSLRRQPNNAAAHVFGLTLRQLRDYWAGREHAVVTTAGDTLFCSGIFDIHYPVNAEQVSLRAFGYHVEHYDGGHSDNRFAYFGQRFKQAIQVPVDWMAARYPFWRQRYEMALAMGYTGHELADFVCVRDDDLLDSAISDEKAA